MPERHKIAQLKSLCRVAADPTSPLHAKVGRTTNSRLKRGIEWLNQATKTIETCTSIENVRRGEAWTAINDEAERLTLVISTLGRECREWAPGAAHAEVELLIADNSQAGYAVNFTDRGDSWALERT